MIKHVMTIEGIVKIGSTLALKKLGLRAFNKKDCWKTNQKKVKKLKKLGQKRYQ